MKKEDIQNLDQIKNIIFSNKLKFDSKKNEFFSQKIKDVGNIKKLKVGTAFSGVGAFEQCLQILDIPHEIIFACDNGGIMFEDIVKSEELKVFNKIKNKQEKLNFVEEVYKKNKRNNFVKQSYLANYELKEDSFYHDIRFLGKHIKKDIDIFVGGSPCQSFSVAGARGGFEDTRGTLFFEFARCVKEFQPKVFIYENVKGLTYHDGGKTFATVLNTFDELGYKYFYKILNSKDYGIPQSRNRIFVIGFRDKNIDFDFPEKEELNYTMADFLIGEVDAKYTLSEKAKKFVLDENRIAKSRTQINGEVALCQMARQQVNCNGDFVDDKYFLSEKLIKCVMQTESRNGSMKFNPTINTEIAKTLTATMHKMHRASMDNYVTTQGRLRRLTPRECFRLMGFPDTFKFVVSDLQLYKQAGNSIVVDVLMAITKEIIKTKVFDKSLI